MATTTRRREDLNPEQAGAYLVGVLLAGLRTGIYRILFNFYVLNQGYEEGLITVLITASVMATAASILPLSYIVDYVGKKPSLIFSIGGTIISVAVMFLFPSRIVFLMLNMMLGMFLALTQVSMGSDDTRYMKLIDRVMYYSLPFAFSAAVNYLISYLPGWLGFISGSSAFDNELILVGIVGVGLFVLLDSKYNQQVRQTTPRRVIARFNVGAISIPLIVENDEGEFPEPFNPFDSIAEQVNFLLQGVLTGAGYDGPPITITENLEGDLTISMGDGKEYLGVDNMPEGREKEWVQRATNLWVEQNLKE